MLGDSQIKTIFNRWDYFKVIICTWQALVIFHLH